MAEQNSSAEITSKIRSAIKAKLTELGAYVDDELPDYIMVMIANKKSKQQMTEDLNLFLGKNSSLFTEWLQNVLDRLQSISRASSTSLTVSHAVSHFVASSASAKPPMSSMSSAKEGRRKTSPDRKKSPPRRRREEKANSPLRRPKRRDSRKGRHASRDDDYSSSDATSDEDEKRRKRSERKETHREELVIKKPENAPATPPPKVDKDDRKSVSVKESTPPREASSATTTARGQQEKPIDADVLVVEAEIEEGDDLADMAIRKTAKETELTLVTTRPAIRQQQRTVTLEETKLSQRPVTPPPIATSSARKPIEAPSPDAPSYGRRHVGTVRPMKRRTPSPNEGPFRKRRSAVGQVVHRPDFSDEEYDPLRPQLGFSASVASTVHVTERKYTVPREMQPKPSIFLRALNEANRSVRLGSRRGGNEEKLESRESSSVQESSGEKTRPGQSAEYSGDVWSGSGRSVFDRVVQGKSTTGSAEAATESESIAKNTKSARRIEFRQPPQPSNIKPLPSQPTPTSKMETELFVDSSSPPPASDSEKRKSESNIGTSTRFVVTMSGVDRRFIERVVVKDEEKKAVKLADEDDRYDDMDTLIVDVDEEELMEEEAMVAYSASSKTTPLYGSGAIGQGPTPAMQIVNPIKISLDDDEDDDDSNVKPGDSVLVTSATPTGSNESLAGSPRVVDSGPLTGMGRLSTASLEAMLASGKILERCRYWPNCQAGAACQYQHPMTNCKNFPQCRFGEKCLYIHPPCKFDPYCKNPSCPFAHSHQLAAPGSIAASYGGGPKFASIIPQQGTAAVIPCKFGGRCLNPTCPFRHPQAACMYGNACTKPNCAYSHRSPVAVPPGSSYKQSRPAPMRRPAAVAKPDSTKFRWVAAPTSRISTEGAPPMVAKSAEVANADPA